MGKDDLTDAVKHLKIKIDENLNWEHHINDISIKSNRANDLLSKIRKYVTVQILRSIAIGIFDCHLNYSCLIWTQNSDSIYSDPSIKSHFSNTFLTSQLSYYLFFQEKFNNKIYR